MEIKEVVITLRNPSGSQGRQRTLCARQLYAYILTMVDEDGKPLRERGGVMRRSLEPGEDPAAVARKLTRDIHIRLTESDGFNRPLYYPDEG